MNLSLAIERNTAFAWLALGTMILLSVPLIAMQVTTEVQWSLMDFAVIALLMLSCGSAFIIVARRTTPIRRKYVGMLMLFLLLAIWVELAVGVFFNIGH